MPTGLVEQQQCVSPWGNIGGDCCEMQVHCRGVAPRQDQSDRLAFLGADGTEDVGGRGPLVGRRGRTAATLGPTTGNLVLLADPGFVAEPDLYVVWIEAAPVCDRRH